MTLTRRCLLASFPAAVFSVQGPSALTNLDQSAKRGVELKLAGMNLQQLQHLYQKELEDDLGFWDKSGLDMEYGGFMCALDHDGTLVNTEKNVTYQGRGIWVYCFLFNHFGKNSKHLDVARKAKEFLFKYARQAGSVWPQVLSREGKIIQPFDGAVYDGLYVSLGLQEYYRATGESETMEEAVQTFFRCMEIYDQPNYGAESAKSEGFPPGSRIQGVEMVVLDLLTQLLQQNPDPRLEKYQKRTVEALLEKFFNSEFRLNNEFLKHDYGRHRETPWQDHVELGYSIASFWNLLQEALRQKNETIFELAAGRLKRHMEVAWDDVYGGLAMSSRVETGCFDYRKVAFVHGEAMIALLLIIEHLGERWAEEWYGRIHHYAFDKFPLRRYPGWHSYMNRKCTPQEHAQRRENFHHPRFLMYNLLTLARLANREEGALERKSK